MAVQFMSLALASMSHIVNVIVVVTKERKCLSTLNLLDITPSPHKSHHRHV
jgi:hypothetical protein